jgi:hypothetical protein
MNDKILCMESGEEEKDKVEDDCRLLIAVCTAKHDVHIGHFSARVLAGHVQHMMKTGQAQQYCSCTLTFESLVLTL